MPRTTVTGPLPPGFVQASDPPDGLLWRDSVTVVLLSDVTIAPIESSTATAIDIDAPALVFVGSVVNASFIVAGAGGRGGSVVGGLVVGGSVVGGSGGGDSVEGGVGGGEPDGPGERWGAGGGSDEVEGVSFELGAVEVGGAAAIGASDGL